MAEPAITDFDQEKASPLVGLPQEIIEGIVTHLDIKSVVRLQLTCHALFSKCLDAQRVKEVAIQKIFYYEREGNRILTIGTRPGTRVVTFGIRKDEIIIDGPQFEATRFRVCAELLVFLVPCTNQDIHKITDYLSGRCTVKTLRVDYDNLDDDVEPDLFNQFLQKFKISGLFVKNFPAEFWELPSVKQMTFLECRRRFPQSLEYLADTSIEKCNIYRPTNTACAELNQALEKWAKNEKVIKRWEMNINDFHEDDLFEGFRVVVGEEDERRRRPVVFSDPLGTHTYRLERADGERLYVQYSALNILVLQDEPLYVEPRPPVLRNRADDTTTDGEEDSSDDSEDGTSSGSSIGGREDEEEEGEESNDQQEGEEEDDEYDYSFSDYDDEDDDEDEEDDDDYE